ncbi:MAG: hypothetical protein HQK50_16060 [Oligoflexia bacterium]|nr:hypothetical protein [Oligoflexia bacterium]
MMKKLFKKTVFSVSLLGLLLANANANTNAHASAIGGKAVIEIKSLDSKSINKVKKQLKKIGGTFDSYEVILKGKATKDYKNLSRWRGGVNTLTGRLEIGNAHVRVQSCEGKNFVKVVAPHKPDVDTKRTDVRQKLLWKKEYKVDCLGDESGENKITSYRFDKHEEIYNSGDDVAPLSGKVFVYLNNLSGSNLDQAKSQIAEIKKNKKMTTYEIVLLGDANSDYNNYAHPLKSVSDQLGLGHNKVIVHQCDKKAKVELSPLKGNFLQRMLRKKVSSIPKTDTLLDSKLCVNIKDEIGADGFKIVTTGLGIKKEVVNIPIALAPAISVVPAAAPVVAPVAAPVVALAAPVVVAVKAVEQPVKEVANSCSSKDDGQEAGKKYFDCLNQVAIWLASGEELTLDTIHQLMAKNAMAVNVLGDGFSKVLPTMLQKYNQDKVKGKKDLPQEFATFLRSLNQKGVLGASNKIPEEKIVALEKMAKIKPVDGPAVVVVEAPAALQVPAPAALAPAPKIGPVAALMAAKAMPVVDNPQKLARKESLPVVPREENIDDDELDDVMFGFSDTEIRNANLQKKLLYYLPHHKKADERSMITERIAADLDCVREKDSIGDLDKYMSKILNLNKGRNEKKIYCASADGKLNILLRPGQVWGRLSPNKEIARYMDAKEAEGDRDFLKISRYHFIIKTDAKGNLLLQDVSLNGTEILDDKGQVVKSINNGENSPLPPNGGFKIGNITVQCKEMPVAKAGKPEPIDDDLFYDSDNYDN